MTTYVNYLFDAYFFLYSVLSFKKKKFFMQSLTALLSPMKDLKFPYATSFNTVNLLCADTVNSWLSLREGLKHFQSRYTKRLELYSTIYLVCFLFLVALSVSSFITGRLLDPVVRGTCVFDSISISLAFLWLLFVGADTNEEGTKHKELLLFTKTTLLTLKRNMHRIEEFGNVYVDGLLKVYSQIVLQLLKTHSLEFVVEGIDGSIQAIDDAILRLEFDEQNNYLSVLGMKASHRLIYSIIGFALSAAFAVYETFQ